LSSDIDTKYFDNFEEEEPWITDENNGKHKKYKKDINFIGYTFKRDQESILLKALLDLENQKMLIQKVDEGPS
jgi:serine/threonine kinase 38